ncbi:MlaD family protein [Rhodospirillum sp. A1_3_36]|uniref:MlaD family protein n=1 Tax=Rhodospirillum sp. A1_3_36 TaxID=3391666 RepID=UPI0039A57A1D
MVIARAFKEGVHGDRAETLIGAVVVLVGVAIMAATSINRHDTGAPEGAYQVDAVFNRADGIGVGSEVRVAGIPVGRVVRHTLDDQYRAVVTMRMDLGGAELSDDAAAKIQTDGLLGSKYIEVVTAGGGYGTIPSGERLDYTQDSVIIEDLLSKIVAMAKVKRGLDPNIPASEQEMPRPQSILDAPSKATPSADEPPACDCEPSPPVNLFAPWAPGVNGKDGSVDGAPMDGESVDGGRKSEGDSLNSSSSPASPASPLTNP